MKNFIVMFAALHVSLFLLQGPSISASASPVDEYLEDDYLDTENYVFNGKLSKFAHESEADEKYAPLTGIDRYKNSDENADKDDDQLVLAFPLIHKRKPATKQQYRFCVPRGRNCDHHPKKCCNSGSCRCNLWGGNCKCQRMGYFQKWDN